jgi:FKBP-type peptidyl-prolyl cis-trans isomerase
MKHLVLLCALVLASCGSSEEPRFRPSPREERSAAEADERPSRPAEAAEAEPGALPAPDDVAAPPASAERTASGLASRVLRPGTGTEHPTASSRVRVHYTGWMTDGTMFDSSITRGEPAEFPLGGVIAGWTEGLQLMVVGEQRRFWIPGNLAYGETPRRPGMPHGTLVFDVELLGIE